MSAKMAWQSREEWGTAVSVFNSQIQKMFWDVNGIGEWNFTECLRKKKHDIEKIVQGI